MNPNYLAITNQYEIFTNNGFFSTNSTISGNVNKLEKSNASRKLGRTNISRIYSPDHLLHFYGRIKVK